jgi:predicted outer membrane repeat protein
MLKGNIVDGQVRRARERDAFVAVAAVCLLLSIAMSATAFATTYYVDYDGVDNIMGTGDDGNDGYSGVSPEAPFRTIQRAIDVAHKDDVIMVRPYGGLAQYPYVENLVVENKKNLTIIGPWDPTPPPFPAQEQDFGRWCKGQHIDGNAVGPVLKIVKSNGILVKNLVFDNGKADYGAGICIKESHKVTLEDCCVLDNEAVQNGGNIWALETDNLVVRQCWVYQNKAVADAEGGVSAPIKGGGIYLEKCEETLIQECRIEENRAAFAGGGVFLQQTDLNMENSCVFRNSVVRTGGMTDGGYGGGLALRGTSKLSADTELKSTKNLYKGNFVRPGNGGAIACYGLCEATPVVTSEWGQTDVVSKEDKFIYNKTDNDSVIPESKRRGGAFMMKGIWSEATFEKATFNENSAHEDGGAAYFVGMATGVFRNCTFSNNEAKDDGGALQVTGYASLEVHDSTFERNIASGHGGGGIHITTNADCTLRGQNIFAECKAPSGGALHVRNASLEANGRVLFSANEATTGDGGALYAWVTKDPGTPGEGGVDGPCTVVLKAPPLFVGNIAEGSGGAIAVYADKPPNFTPYKLSFHLEGYENEPATVSGNEARTLDDTGVRHAGLWVYEAHPRAGTEIYVRRSVFGGHRLVGGNETACTVIGAGPVVFPLAACRILNSKFYKNRTSILLRKVRCHLDFLKIHESDRVGVAAQAARGSVRHSIVASSGQVDIDLSQGSNVVIEHCELNGHATFPGGLQVSADSRESRISQSNICGHTNFGASYPWVPSAGRVYAQHNYWGSPNGPHDPSTADGWENYNPGGDFVSDGIDYRRYKKKAFTIITNDP